MRKDHINCDNVRMLYVILVVLCLLLVLDEGCLSVSSCWFPILAMHKNGKFRNSNNRLVEALVIDILL